MFALWLTCFASLLGSLMTWSGEFQFFSLFLVFGYLAALLAFWQAARSWKDLFNPLCVFLMVGTLRFSLPAFLLMLGVDPQVWLFQAMGLRSTDWEFGHVLALTGMLGVVLGWSLASGPSGEMPPLRFGLTSGTGRVALGAMVLGFVALLLFVSGNASLVDVIVSGGFRRATVLEGTGKFFFLSHLLISGSVILSGHLLSKRNRPTATSVTPVVLAMLSFWILGGRVRAMTALVSGLLLLWYLRREQRGWTGAPMKPMYLLVLIGIPFMTWVGYLGQLYRDGMGLRAFAESLSISGLWEYVQWAVFVDIGQLHALAGAAAIGPGVLEGTTFVHRLLWPISQILELPGRNVGVFILEKLVGIGQRKWAVAPSLIGDAYLNFGVPAIPIVMGIFGLLVKMLYVRFREGSIHSIVYVLTFVYSVQIFLGGLDAWIYFVVIAAFTVLNVLLGGLFTRRRVRGRRASLEDSARFGYRPAPRAAFVTQRL